MNKVSFNGTFTSFWMQARCEELVRHFPTVYTQCLLNSFSFFELSSIYIMPLPLNTLTSPPYSLLHPGLGLHRVIGLLLSMPRSPCPPSSASTNAPESTHHFEYLITVILSSKRHSSKLTLKVPDTRARTSSQTEWGGDVVTSNPPQLSPKGCRTRYDELGPLQPPFADIRIVLGTLSLCLIALLRSKTAGCCVCLSRPLVQQRSRARFVFVPIHLRRELIKKWP